MAAPTGLLSGGSPREANVGWVERSDTHRPRSHLPMGIAFGSTHPADLSRAMTYERKLRVTWQKDGTAKHNESIRHITSPSHPSLQHQSLATRPHFTADTAHQPSPPPPPQHPTNN